MYFFFFAKREASSMICSMRFALKQIDLTQFLSDNYLVDGRARAWLSLIFIAYNHSVLFLSNLSKHMNDFNATRWNLRQGELIYNLCFECRKDRICPNFHFSSMFLEILSTQWISLLDLYAILLISSVSLLGRLRSCEADIKIFVFESSLIRASVHSIQTSELCLRLLSRSPGLWIIFMNVALMAFVAMVLFSDGFYGSYQISLLLFKNAVGYFFPIRKCCRRNCCCWVGK